jgi:hypothetical protein
VSDSVTPHQFSSEIARWDRCTYVYVGRIDVAVDSRTSAESTALTVTYTLRNRGGERGALTMFDPEILTIGDISCAAAAITRTRSEGYAVIYFRLRRGAMFDGATVQMRVRWDDRAVKRLNGSPVCVLPSHLPLPLTPHGPYIGQQYSDPTGVAVEPRLALSAPLSSFAGTVIDDARELLMIAAR